MKLQSIKEKYKEFKVFEQEIKDRVSLILNTIGQHCEDKTYQLKSCDINYYDVPWHECKESFNDCFKKNLGLEFLRVEEIEPYINSKHTNVIINGIEINLIEDGFPSEWLEIEFTDPLIKGIKEYKQKSFDSKSILELEKQEEKIKQEKLLFEELKKKYES